VQGLRRQNFYGHAWAVIRWQPDLARGGKVGWVGRTGTSSASGRCRSGRNSLGAPKSATGLDTVAVERGTDTSRSSGMPQSADRWLMARGGGVGVGAGLAEVTRLSRVASLLRVVMPGMYSASTYLEPPASVVIFSLGPVMHPRLDKTVSNHACAARSLRHGETIDLESHLLIAT
jgi:hypothetical protein